MEGKGRAIYLVLLLGIALTAPLLLNRPEPASEAAPGAAGGGAPAPTAPALAAPAVPAPLSAGQAKARAALETRTKIETDHYVAQVSNLNGGLASLKLKGERFLRDGEPINLVTTDKERYYPFGIDVDAAADPGAVYEVTPLPDGGLRLHGNVRELDVVRKMEPGKSPYQLWLTTRIVNPGETSVKFRLRVSTHHYVTRESESGGVPLLPVRSPSMSNGLCRHGEELEREDRTSLTEEPLGFGGAIGFTGVENVYFLAAAAPETGEVEGCRMEASDRGRDEEGEAMGTLFTSTLNYRELELPPGQHATFRTLAYVGPKTPDELIAAGHALKLAIETGWFTALAEGLTWLLRFIFDFVGNWGIAIILLTLVVKLVLFPLTVKQMQSMARMKELKPQMDELNERFGDDREAKGAAMMELYRNEGVNPMAGCFPMLLQLPIWFSLYQSLASNVELFHAPFAVWADLSAPDPFFALPLALGVLMFVQQKIMPAATTDPLQQKMMLYMMPTMITSFMLFLPAGLCLYMFTNSALSIGQQRMIEAQLAKNPPKAAKGAQDDSSSQDRSKDSPEGSTKDSSQDASEGDTADQPDSRKRPKTNRPSKAERRSRRGKK
ncbi:MAG: membrane protein insertase YidC [Myxococcales bacterium]|nr:membrane protein insertase YidC [Myxococcales bacterium]